MATPPVDPQVEDRVAQLEAISRRRNELLREMYHMLRRRQHIGVMLPDPEDEDDGSEAETFLDRFDLQKHPDTGSIENLTELDLSLSPPPHSDDEPALEDVPVDHDDPPTKSAIGAESDSPMSEPPPSPEPAHEEGSQENVEIEEGLQCLVEPQHESPMELDRTQSEYRTASASPSAPGYNHDEPDMGEGDASSVPVTYEEREDTEAEEDRDELDLISNRSSSPYRRDATSQAPRSSSVFPHEDADGTAEDGSEGALARSEVEEASEEEYAESEQDSLQDLSADVDESGEFVQEDDTVNDETELERPEEPGSQEPSVLLNHGETRQDEGSQYEVQEGSQVAVPATTADQDVSMADVVEEYLHGAEDQSENVEATTERGSSPEDSQGRASEFNEFPSEEVQLYTVERTQDSPTSAGQIVYPERDSVTEQLTEKLEDTAGHVSIARRSPTEVRYGVEESEFSPLSSNATTPAAGDVQTQPALYVIPAPSSPVHDYPSYDFSPLVHMQDVPARRPATPSGNAAPRIKQSYTLPPLKALPPEFNRKGKPAKQRKRDKDRDKGDKTSERGDFAPLGVNRWGASLRANPVWKRVSRAQKCLSTRDWNVAYTELRFVRALDRIELLKDKGKWSFRQPKKQRAVGITMKTHWDYLLEEMKWMRVDFREERKFKHAIAFDLACAAVDWHAAGTTEERHKLGISVFWKRPRPSQEPVQIDADVEAPPDEDLDEEAANRDGKNPMSMIDYPSSEGSEADDDQEQDNAAQDNDVIDDLEADTAFRDALDDLERNRDLESAEPKVEDAEDQNALAEGNQDDTMAVDNVKETDNGPKPVKVEEGANSMPESALKSGASDPILGVPSVHPRPIFKPNTYLQLRDSIVYSNADMLFLDLDDMDIYRKPSSTSSEEDVLRGPHPPTDLSEIFPELRPLEMLEPPSGTIAVVEGKKKGDKKEDPHRRVDETNLTKLTPMSQFMHLKPTLIGPVQPSKRWRQGRWLHSEEPVVLMDFENVPSRVQPDKMPQCGLFIGHTKAAGDTPSKEHYMAPPAPKDAKKRVTEYPWASSEDSLLKSLADKFLNNWQLIAEYFNSSRVVLNTDKRTPWDCYERWCTKWGGGSTLRELPETPHRDMPPPPPPGQMTTRGVKRSASALQSPTSPGPNITNSSGPLALTTDTRKRRRHQLIHDTMRKTAKRREAAQKTAGQRKPTAVHDTHGQYNSLPKHTPLELSRKKAEKDAKANEVMRRDQEIARQQHLQQRHMQGIQVQGVPNMVQIQQAQMLQQQHNGAPRLPGTGLPPSGLPQIRNQASPPRTSATPTNQPNPTRPPSAQSQQSTVPTMQSVQPGAMPRPPIPNIGHYYQIHGAALSTEQMEQAIRMQSMQYAHMHAQALQVRAQQTQNAQAQAATGQSAIPQAGQSSQYPQQ
ncbi:hypothetical protein NEOLEDRAFT_1175782 [Neolentinus lepideus HHB14362 ss-1]|uniref:Vacuolar import and degradation protein 21 n=1 Tax=Neolentinus lepideus HHB14362 ss-1 TaxID=1314782 RepID=A0A165UNV3_9AGAM|nr:hypothetical protein NEOLEDRAFT_1175782 [Neolentinus lepideus HHB14362 ss-1]